MHRLEVHRAGMVEASLAGSTPLTERSELLKTYRSRWESLRWTKVTQLQLNPILRHQFVGTTLVYGGAQPAPILHYHRLPFGGSSGSSWEDRQLESDNRSSIQAFSENFGTNLLAVLVNEWFENVQ